MNSGSAQKVIDLLKRIEKAILALNQQPVPSGSPVAPPDLIALPDMVTPEPVKKARKPRKAKQ